MIPDEPITDSPAPEPRRVAVESGPAHYPSSPPFHPAESYPELAGIARRGEEPNPAYARVRQALASLGLDRDRFGTAAWNPLRALVQPGDTVVLKPNLIRESHARRADEWQQVITHGSIVRAVVDYVLLGTGGDVRIIIADGPQTDSDFDAICRRSGLFGLVRYYRSHGHRIELLDLRRDRWFTHGTVTHRRVELPGDPAGYTTVDLGAHSEFADYALNGEFYGADYDMAETRRFHADGRHAYVLCRTVLDADVVINLPKLKTHKKTGVTLCLKNMVGVNGYRNCLPHHTIGTPDRGGDEFPATDLGHRLQSRMIVGFKRMLARRGGTGGAGARLAKRAGAQLFGRTHDVVRSGNWHGNDTLWRTVLDLNKIVLHFDGTGQRRRTPRRYLAIVDGIVAGEGDGPVGCDAKPCGVVVAGLNPVAVDTACATLMGFEPARIPVLSRAWQARGPVLAGFEPADVEWVSSTVLASGVDSRGESPTPAELGGAGGPRGLAEPRPGGRVGDPAEPRDPGEPRPGGRLGHPDEPRESGEPRAGGRLGGATEPRDSGEPDHAPAPRALGTLPGWRFRPHFGWSGHIEADREPLSVPA